MKLYPAHDFPIRFHRAPKPPPNIEKTVDWRSMFYVLRSFRLVASYQFPVASEKKATLGGGYSFTGNRLLATGYLL